MSEPSKRGALLGGHLGQLGGLDLSAIYGHSARSGRGGLAGSAAGSVGLASVGGASKATCSQVRLDLFSFLGELSLRVSLWTGVDGVCGGSVLRSVLLGFVAPRGVGV